VERPDDLINWASEEGRAVRHIYQVKRAQFARLLTRRNPISWPGEDEDEMSTTSGAGWRPASERESERRGGDSQAVAAVDRRLWCRRRRGVHRINMQRMMNGFGEHAKRKANIGAQ